jgi:DNA adenine methylase Dam
LESEVAHTLKAEGADASEDGTGRGVPMTVDRPGRVRRLTVLECERLMALPDNWTLIPTAKRNHRDPEMIAYLRRQRPDLDDDALSKLSADGPRYKAIGNSMAVNCMRWIGQRIARVDAIPAIPDDLTRKDLFGYDPADGLPSGDDDGRNEAEEPAAVDASPQDREAPVLGMDDGRDRGGDRGDVAGSLPLGGGGHPPPRRVRTRAGRTAGQAPGGVGSAPRPFLKWVGGKRRTAERIVALLPDGRRHVEPFVGSGAVFFAMCRKAGKPIHAVLGDVNQRLMRTYGAVRDDVEPLIAKLSYLWLRPQSEASYLEARDHDPDAGSDAEVGAWLIHLNRAGFNGLYRVNAEGRINVAWAKRERLGDFDAFVANLHACSLALQETELVVGDGVALLDDENRRIGENDVVYCDPPHLGTFDDYTAAGFDMAAHERLVSACRRAVGRGAFATISGSVGSVGPYAALRRIDIPVFHSVSKRGDRRGAVVEGLFIIEAGTVNDETRLTTHMQSHMNRSINESTENNMTQRPIVIRVDSPDLKGGVHADLGPRTLIVGPNAAHKSAITDAVGLALTGVVDDTIGRDTVAMPAMLVELGDGDKLETVAKLSTGTTAKYTLKRKADGSVTKKHSGGFPDAFPLRAVNEALTGSVEKARAWLLKRVGGAISFNDVLMKFPTELRATVIDAANAAGAGEGTGAADALLLAMGQAKAWITAAESEADAHDRIANERAATVGPEPLESEITTAVLAVASFSPVSGQPVIDIAALRAESTRRIETYNVSKSAFDLLPVPEDVGDAAANEVKTERLVATAKVLEFIIDRIDRGVSDLCVCCGGALPRDVAMTRWGIVTDGVETLNGRFAAMRDWTSRRDALPTLRKIALDAIANVEAAEKSTSVSSDDSARNAARDKHNALVNAKATWATILTARRASASARQRGKEAEALIVVAKSIIGALLDSAVSSFVAKVQRHLPAGWIFKLLLSEGEKAVCRFGFDRNGRLHTTLSGAEWALLMAAITAAVSEDIGADQPVVIVPEDRGWDARTLAKAMAALGNAPAQILMHATIEPEWIPIGWTVIHVGSVSTSPVADTLDPDPDKVSSPTEPAMGEPELRALGWTPEQISRMNANATRYIREHGTKGDGYSVLSNGALFDVATGVIAETQPDVIVPTQPDTVASKAKAKGPRTCGTCGKELKPRARKCPDGHDPSVVGNGAASVLGEPEVPPTLGEPATLGEPTLVIRTPDSVIAELLE